MKLLARYLAELNREYLSTRHDRREARQVISWVLLALTLLILIYWQAPALDAVLALQPPW